MSVSEHDTQLLMLVIPNNSDFGLQVLDRKVNSMKRKAHQKIPCGKTADEKPKFGTSYICKVWKREKMESNKGSHRGEPPESISPMLLL